MGHGLVCPEEKGQMGLSKAILVWFLLAPECSAWELTASSARQLLPADKAVLVRRGQAQPWAGLGVQCSFEFISAAVDVRSVKTVLSEPGSCVPAPAHLLCSTKPSLRFYRGLSQALDWKSSSVGTVLGKLLGLPNFLAQG